MRFEASKKTILVFVIVCLTVLAIILTTSIVLCRKSQKAFPNLEYFTDPLVVDPSTNATELDFLVKNKGKLGGYYSKSLMTNNITGSKWIVKHGNNDQHTKKMLLLESLTAKAINILSSQVNQSQIPHYYKNGDLYIPFLENNGDASVFVKEKSLVPVTDILNIFQFHIFYLYLSMWDFHVGNFLYLSSNTLPNVNGETYQVIPIDFGWSLLSEIVQASNKVYREPFKKPFDEGYKFFPNVLLSSCRIVLPEDERVVLKALLDAVAAVQSFPVQEFCQNDLRHVYEAAGLGENEIKKVCQDLHKRKESLTIEVAYKMAGIIHECSNKTSCPKKCTLFT